MDTFIYEPVLRPFVGDVFERLNADQIEAWQERSAVLEFDAGLPRPLAEALALIELLRRNPTILAQVHALEIDRCGARQWLLTNDLSRAVQNVVAIGGVEIGCHPIAEVVRDQFSGIALLGPLR